MLRLQILMCVLTEYSLYLVQAYTISAVFAVVLMISIIGYFCNKVTSKIGPEIYKLIVSVYPHLPKTFKLQSECKL